LSGLFNVFVTRHFERSFKRLDKVARDSVLRKVEELRRNPFLGRRMVSRPVFYIRAGDYRIFYNLNVKNKVIILVDVKHRREAYR